MKKILIFCLTIFFAQNIFAIEKNITVSAIVWSIDVPSKIEITSPDYLNDIWAVHYIQNWSSFAVDFLITDPENSDIYFTVSTDDWVVSVENWWPVSTSWGFAEQFVFLAWSATWLSEITITSNDWVTVSSKILQIYIY